MKLKILIGILVFLIVVNLATIGSFFYFQMQRPSFPKDRSRIGQHFDREKQQQLRALFHKFEEETRELRKEMHLKERELMNMLSAEVPDRPAIDQKMREISELRMAIANRVIDNLLETEEFLSPRERQILFQRLIESRQGPPGFREPPFRGKSRFRPGEGRGFPSGETPEPEQNQ